MIIFDEPTTSLTRREVQRLFAIIARLRDRGIGMIYISHALEDVRAICDHIVVLRDGHLIGAGPTADMPTPRIISMMVGRSIDTIFPDRAAPPAGATVLSVTGLSQPGVVDNISFDIRRGEIVGLAGLMGSGRSELARILFGLDPYQTGTIAVDGATYEPGSPRAAMAAGVAFLTEDRRTEGLLMAMPIADNTVLASLGRFRNALGLLDRTRIGAVSRQMARIVHLSTDKVDSTLVKHLSGGNQQKVVIGKWLLREPRLFILDEPTRGIDVGAKQEVYRIINQLVEGGGAVLLISSEIEEVIGLADRILTINAGELTGEFHRDAFDRETIMAAAALQPGRTAETAR